MKCLLSIAWLLATLTVAAGADDLPIPVVPGPTEVPPEADPVTIRLVSGRTVSGDVDPQTDAAQLWLRTERGAAVLLRPIAWNHVVRATVLGEPLSGEQFRQAVVTLRRDVPPPPKPQPPGGLLILKTSAGSPQPPPQPADLTPSAPPASPVRHLAIDAAVADWDENVGVDGLVIQIRPLDGRGRMVPVWGTLEVELIGSRAVKKFPQPFSTMGRWVRQVGPDDFGPLGAEYGLAFQGVQPEYDTQVVPYGAVHATLTVPGQGTFETTQSSVRIRPSSLVRDQLQRTTRQRFFPGERTHDRPLD